MKINKYLDLTVAEIRKNGKVGRRPGADGEKLSLYTTAGSWHLTELKADITKGQYRPRPLRRVLMAKRAGEAPREIYDPTNRDYLTSKAILSYLLNEKSSTNQLPASVVARSALDAINNNLNATIVKLDVKDFFPSVSASTLLNSLLEEKIDREIVDLIIKFSHCEIWKDKGFKSPALAQGIPFSPWVANCIAAQVVEKIRSCSGVVSVSRYLDDMIVLLDTPGDRVSYARYLKEIFTVRKIKKIWKKYNFSIYLPGEDNSKSKIVSEGEDFTFLGFDFLKNKNEYAMQIPEFRLSDEKSKVWKLFSAHLRGRGYNGGNYSNVGPLRTLQYKIFLRSKGWSYRGQSYGFCNYYGQVGNPRDFILLDRYVLGLCSRWGIPNFNAGYEDSFKKVRSIGYHPYCYFEFDKWDVAMKVRSLIYDFSYQKDYVYRMSSSDVEVEWDRIIDRERRSMVQGDMAY